MKDCEIGLVVKDCLKPLDGKDNEEDRYDSPAMKSGGKKD